MVNEPTDGLLGIEPQAGTRDGTTVIIVTRLNGGLFGVNPDLVQRVESAPDTILTLIDGSKYIVAESMAEVISRITEHRALVLARARELEADRQQLHLAAVPSEEELPEEPDDDPDRRGPHDDGRAHLRTVR